MGTIANLAVNIEAGTANFTGPMRDAMATMDRFGYAGEQGRRAFNQTRTELERYSLQIEKYDKLLASGKVNQEIYNRLVAQAKEKLDEAGASAERTGHSFAGIAVGAAAIYATARAAVASAEGIAHWVEGAGESIIQADHLSQRLGMTVEEFSRLDYVAKMTHTSTEALTTGLQRMLSTLGDVSDDEGKKAADVLQRLHLDPLKLTGESPLAAFMDITDALSHVGSAFEKASDARAIFSRGGQELIPLLALQREGIERLFSAADTKHRIITDEDVAEMRQAGEAMADMQSAIDALGRRLAIGLGPAAAEVAKQIEHIADSAKGFQVASESMQSLQTLAHYGADSIQVLGIAFQEMRVTATAAIAEILVALDKVAQAHAWIVKQFGVHEDVSWVHTYAQDMVDEATNQSAIMKEKMQAPWAHEQVDEYFKAIQRGAQSTQDVLSSMQQSPMAAVLAVNPKVEEGITKLIERLQQERDALNGGSTAAKIHELALAGASAAQVAQAQSLDLFISGMKESHKAATEAAAYVQQLQDRIAQLNGQSDETAGLDHMRKAFGDLVAEIQAGQGKLAPEEMKLLVDSASALGHNIDYAAQALQQLHDIKIGDIAKGLQESAEALAATHAALAAGSSAGMVSEAARNAKELADLQKKLTDSHADASQSAGDLAQLKANEAMDHSNKLLEEGARLRESLLSPQQKLNEEMAHYATLLKAGAIDQATYAAAVEKAQESIQKAMGETIDFKVFDAANFNFGAFAQLGAPGQGLFGGNAGRRPPGPNGQPPGAPPVPPPLGNSATEETAWRQTMLDLMQKMQPDVHTCAANGSGLVQ